MHPFEKAGLGKAPFHCVGHRENRFEMPGFGWKPGGCCHYCGTGILHEYIIRSVDGAEFVVGSDCVERTGTVENFTEIRRESVRAHRQAGTKARREAAQAERIQERSRLTAARKEFWSNAHPELFKTLQEYQGDNLFLRDMRDSLTHWGGLTDGQTAAVERVLARDAQQAAIKASSQHLGTIGQRIKGLSIRITFCKHIGTSNFNGRSVPRYLVKLETESGDQLVWWTSRGYEKEESFGPVDLTVKEHGEYNGTKQTIVQRITFKAPT